MLGFYTWISDQAFLINQNLLINPHDHENDKGARVKSSSKQAIFSVGRYLQTVLKILKFQIIHKGEQLKVG